jgi:hypothetical protein
MSLTSTSVLAHSGHLPSEAAHGLLHIEHIIALVAFVIVAFTAANWNKK